MCRFGEAHAGKYPMLARVGLAVANVRISSAGVERQASTGGLVDTAKRHMLNPNTFEMLCFIADNRAILEEIGTEKVKKLTYKEARFLLKHGCKMVRADGEVPAVDAPTVAAASEEQEPSDEAYAEDPSLDILDFDNPDAYGSPEDLGMLETDERALFDSYFATGGIFDCVDLLIPENPEIGFTDHDELQDDAL